MSGTSAHPTGESKVIHRGLGTYSSRGEMDEDPCNAWMNQYPVSEIYDYSDKNEKCKQGPGGWRYTPGRGRLSDIMSFIDEPGDKQTNPGGGQIAKN